MENMRIESIPAKDLRAGDVVALRVDQVLSNENTGKIEFVDVEAGPLLPDQECCRVYSLVNR